MQMMIQQSLILFPATMIFSNGEFPTTRKDNPPPPRQKDRKTIDTAVEGLR